METYKIIGYTDSVSECDCCGKTELKGTYCLEIDGVELYYGSVCAFKNHNFDLVQQKEYKQKFTKEQKNKKLYELHITPLKNQLVDRLNNAFNTTDFEKLTGVAKGCYDNIVKGYELCILAKAKRYKITLPSNS